MKNFILENYMIVIVVLAFLLFALIGYLIDASKNKKREETNKDQDENPSYIEEVSLNEEPSQDETVLPEVPINDDVIEEMPIVDETLNDSELKEDFVVSNKPNDNIPEVENDVNETKNS